MVSTGIFLTTFCASLSCLIGGSRVLESVCKDLPIFPLKNIYQFNRWNNPIGSVLVSCLVVELFLFVGSLNKISKICSVLYLLAYAAVNFAYCLIGTASASNFR